MPKRELVPVDDGHEHDFGQADYTRRLTDNTRCRLCGVKIIAGYELPLWPEDSSTAGSEDTP